MLYCLLVVVGPPTRPGGYYRVFLGLVKVGRRTRRVPCARAAGFFPHCNVTTYLITNIAGGSTHKGKCLGKAGGRGGRVNVSNVYFSPQVLRSFVFGSTTPSHGPRVLRAPRRCLPDPPRNAAEPGRRIVHRPSHKRQAGLSTHATHTGLRSHSDSPLVRQRSWSWQRRKGSSRRYRMRRTDSTLHVPTCHA